VTAITGARASCSGRSGVYLVAPGGYDPVHRQRQQGQPEVLGLMPMEAKNADLSALRIDRATDPAVAAPGARRWLAIGLPVAGVVVVGAILLATSGALGSAVPVRLTPATMVSPIRSGGGAVLIASGYVVAQRKAAVASKGTGRLVYLGVVEGDRVRAGQVIARIEDADVRAQLAQAQANLDLSRADLRDGRPLDGRGDRRRRRHGVRLGDLG
jgi:HlyD family secretion protein